MQNTNFLDLANAPEKIKRTSAAAPAPGYLIKSPCGRAWFVPLMKVGEDYADFLRQADGLSAADAKKKSDKNRDFWPTWFAEQCNLWGDIDRLGRLVEKSALFKTKAALDRRRGRENDGIGHYTEAVM